MRQRLLTMTSIVLLLFGVAGFVITHYGPVQLLSVQSNSMAPALKHGDVVLVHRVTSNQLRTGEVVTFYSNLQPGITVTHRIVGINYAKHWIITRGDASNILDAKTPFSAVIGANIGHLPRLGLVLTALRGLPGLIIACYIPAVLLLLSEIEVFAHRLEQPTYRRRTIHL